MDAARRSDARIETDQSLRPVLFDSSVFGLLGLVGMAEKVFGEASTCKHWQAEPHAGEIRIRPVSDLEAALIEAGIVKQAEDDLAHPERWVSVDPDSL